MPYHENPVVWAGLVLRFGDGTVRTVELDGRHGARVTCRIDARELDELSPQSFSELSWREVVGRYDGVDIRLRSDGAWTFYPAQPPLWYRPGDADEGNDEDEDHEHATEP